jgi:hypothetical protein
MNRTSDRERRLVNTDDITEQLYSPDLSYMRKTFLNCGSYLGFLFLIFELGSNPHSPCSQPIGKRSDPLSKLTISFKAVYNKASAEDKVANN